MPRISDHEKHLFEVTEIELFETIKASYDADKILCLISAYYAPNEFTKWFEEMRHLHEIDNEDGAEGQNEAIEVHAEQYSNLRNQTRNTLTEQTARLSISESNCDDILDNLFSCYSRISLTTDEMKFLNLHHSEEAIEVQNRQHFITYLKKSISAQHDIKLLLATAWRLTSELTHTEEAQHLILFLLEESRVGYSKKGLYLANEKWSCLDGIIDRLLDNMQTVLPQNESNAVMVADDPARSTFDNLIEPYLYRDQDKSLQPKALLIALYLKSIELDFDIKFHIVRQEQTHFQLDTTRLSEIKTIAETIILREYESLLENITLPIPLPLNEKDYDERNDYLANLVSQGKLSRIAKGRILQIETNPENCAHELLETINASNNPAKWPEIPREYFIIKISSSTKITVEKDDTIIDDDAYEHLFLPLLNENSSRALCRILLALQKINSHHSGEDRTYTASFIHLLNHLYPLNGLNHFLIDGKLPLHVHNIDSVLEAVSSITEEIENAIISFRSEGGNDFFNCYCISDAVIAASRKQLDDEFEIMEEADDFYAVAPFCNDQVYCVVIHTILNGWFIDSENISEENKIALQEQFEVIITALLQHAAYWNYPLTWQTVRSLSPASVLDEQLLCICFELACKQGSTDLLPMILDTASQTLEELEQCALELKMEPFIKAALHDRRFATIEYLITHGATINPTGLARDDNPLIIAAIYLDELAIKSLVYHGANLNESNLLGSTPLHTLAHNSNQDDGENIIKIIEFMVSHGANINQRDGYGHTPLQYLRYVLSAEQIDTCIHQFHAINLPLARFHHSRIYQFDNLFKYANTEALKAYLSRPRRYTRDLLTIAIETKNWDNILVFLQMIQENHFRYSDFNTYSPLTVTPLTLALTSHAPASIIKKLLDVGAKIEQYNGDNSNALHHVMTLEQISVMTLNETMLNRFDRNGATPLYIAVINGRWDIAKVMLEAGANPSYKVPSGTHHIANDSAVIHIIAKGDLELIAHALENSVTFIDSKTYNLEAAIKNHPPKLLEQILNMLDTHKQKLLRMAENDRLFAFRGTRKNKRRLQEESDEDTSRPSKRAKHDDDENKKPKI